ncbi:MAG: hypothetical protein ACYC6C_05145 [Coriobacteriia bacterium]
MFAQKAGCSLQTSEETIANVTAPSTAAPVPSLARMLIVLFASTFSN